MTIPSEQRPQAIFEKLQKQCDDFDKNEEELLNQIEKLNKFQDYILNFESSNQTISQNLDLIEDRQKRFEKFISFFENNESKIVFDEPRRDEVIYDAYNLFDAIDSHNEELNDKFNHSTTLKDAIQMFADLKARLEILENIINNYNLHK